jgi:AP2-associated kinase
VFISASKTDKKYTLKHIICNDGKSLDLDKKEVAISRSLHGHPNVVTLHAQTVYDLGRRMLSGHGILRKGSGKYSGEQRRRLPQGETDPSHVPRCIANRPPFAHKDLKAENVLIDADGV